MIHHDAIIDPTLVKQFAGQAQNANADLHNAVIEGFSEDKSVEFYQGMVAGFANAHTFFHSVKPDDFEKFIGVILAISAHILLKKIEQEK